MTKEVKDMALLEVEGENVVLFHPHIPKTAATEVADTLNTRWIGQGPKVDKFEQEFTNKFAPDRYSLAVGSGTDALHLSYILAGIKEGDEVIAPIFTCTATNIPLLYLRAKIRFADVQPNTLNIDPNHVRRLINDRTKAIVCVHYGGLPCDMDEIRSIAREHGIPVIEDAAQALGAKYKGKYIGDISEFTAFSFQAIKHITTGDGGLMVTSDPDLYETGKRVRWFGIDRRAKQMGVWENDIKELGYKYQMTDVGASLGLAGLREFDEIIKYRQELLNLYNTGLKNIPGIKLIGDEFADREHAAWVCTILAENRFDLQKKLREHRIESNQVHYRNDRYSIFGGRSSDAPNMDALEDKYLVLPLHTKVKTQDIERICSVIKSGW